MFGHLLTPDSIGPAMGGSTALLSLLGGVFFPITSGVMLKIAQALPSYWLVQAGHVGLGGPGWTTTGWLVVAAWTLGAAGLARAGPSAATPAGSSSPAARSPTRAPARARRPRLRPASRPPT